MGAGQKADPGVALIVVRLSSVSVRTTRYPGGAPVVTVPVGSIQWHPVGTGVLLFFVRSYLGARVFYALRLWVHSYITNDPRYYA